MLISYPLLKGEIKWKINRVQEVQEVQAINLLPTNRVPVRMIRIKILHLLPRDPKAQTIPKGELFFKNCPARSPGGFFLGKNVFMEPTIERIVRNEPSTFLKGHNMARSQNYSQSRGSRGRNMPERDDEGRFMSDDRDNDNRSSRSRSSSRYDMDNDNRSRQGGGRGQGHGGWFGDSEGHSEASRRGWQNSDHGDSGWFGDSKGHSDASRRGWQNSDHGDSGWFGDSEGHSEAARRGWGERGGGGRSSSRSRGSSRYGRDDDNRSSRSDRY